MDRLAAVASLAPLARGLIRTLNPQFRHMIGAAPRNRERSEQGPVLVLRSDEFLEIVCFLLIVEDSENVVVPSTVVVHDPHLLHVEQGTPDASRPPLSAPLDGTRSGLCVGEATPLFTATASLHPMHWSPPLAHARGECHDNELVRTALRTLAFRVCAILVLLKA